MIGIRQLSGVERAAILLSPHYSSRRKEGNETFKRVRGFVKIERAQSFLRLDRSGCRRFRSSGWTGNRVQGIRSSQSNLEQRRIKRFHALIFSRFADCLNDGCPRVTAIFPADVDAAVKRVYWRKDGKMIREGFWVQGSRSYCFSMVDFDGSVISTCSEW